MRRTPIILFLFLYSTLSFSQKKESKTYGYFGATAFINEESTNYFGPTVGIGHAVHRLIGIGGGVDFLLSKNLKCAQVYADFRFFMEGTDKAVSPFISLQPGHILYSSDQRIGGVNIKTRGAFAGNVLVGVSYRPDKGLGLLFEAGYSNISFTTNDKTFHDGGLKLGLGISF